VFECGHRAYWHSKDFLLFVLSCAAHGKEATDRDPCKGVLSEKEQHVFVEPSGLTEEEEEEYDDGDDGGEAGC
jgi:hypothetical protein